MDMVAFMQRGIGQIASVNISYLVKCNCAITVAIQLNAIVLSQLLSSWFTSCDKQGNRHSEWQSFVMLKLDDLKEISHTSPIWKRAGDKVLGGRKWPGVVLSVIVVTTVFLIIVAKRWVCLLCTNYQFQLPPKKQAMVADFAEKNSSQWSDSRVVEAPKQKGC